MTTKTNILTFDIGITKLRQYDRTTLVSNTINTVYAAFSKSDNCTWKSTDMWRVVSKGTIIINQIAVIKYQQQGSTIHTSSH